MTEETVVQEHDGQPLTRAWLLTEQPLFERVILAVILLNTALLVGGLFIEGSEHTLEMVHHVILAVFTAELLIKFAAVRCAWRVFFNKKWNVFDTVVIVLSVVPFLGEGMLLLRMARLSRLLHSARHIQHMRLAKLVGWERRPQTTGLEVRHKEE